MEEAKKQYFTTKDALAHGWQNTKSNFWFIVVLLLVIYVVSYVTKDLAIGFLVSIFTGFIVASVFLRISRGVKVDFKNLFIDLSPGKFIQYIIAMFISTVFIVVGMLFLIVPGVIIAIMMSLTAYVMMDESKNVSWKSNTFWLVMKRSKKLVSGEKWNLLAFFFVAFALNILGALAFGLGLLVTVPVTCIGLGYIYDSLVKKHSHEENQHDSNTGTLQPSETTTNDINH